MYIFWNLIYQKDDQLQLLRVQESHIGMHTITLKTTEWISEEAAEAAKQAFVLPLLLCSRHDLVFWHMCSVASSLPGML